MIGLILNAGRGSRLGTEAEPHKSQVVVGGQTILQRQVHCLLRAGVLDIRVVTGYNRAVVEEQPYCHFIYNPIWATTGTAFSLYRALSVIGLMRPVLLLNGDVVFDQYTMLDFISRTRDGRGSLAMIRSPQGDDLVDREAIAVEMNGWEITRIGKDLPLADAEAVGVYFLSPQLMTDYMAEYTEGVDREVYYEDVIDRLLPRSTILLAEEAVGRVMEIDFPDDLDQAREIFRERG